MPFSQLYKPLIESEKSVSKTLIRPRNIYRIQAYEYIDGTNKTFTGIHTAYVFVIGIYDKKLNCIKISEVRPQIFSTWFKSVLRKRINSTIIDESKTLSDIIVRGNLTGNSFFAPKVKSAQIYKQPISVYRTYILQNVKQVKEITLKKQYIKDLLGIKTPMENLNETSGTNIE